MLDCVRYFNNWNIIHFANKATYSEDLNKVLQVVLDSISENMASLVKTGTTTIVYYVIKFL